MAKAVAHANIALVKYWGKRDAALNLPVAGSLSLTLDGLRTETTVERLGRGGEDEVRLNGELADAGARRRVQSFVDRVRAQASSQEAVRVESHNHFPTASGLASSASAFAALAGAACAAFGLERSEAELSVLARLGSGSAARSIFGGFARMQAGERADGQDAHAVPVASQIELGAVIGLVTGKAKAVGSTEGMNRTRETSPYDRAWIQTVERDLPAVEQALRSGDFDELARLTEGNCLAMHANGMAARPGLIYWAPATIALMHTVRSLRAGGVPTFFTIDAGPHVVAFCSPEAMAEIQSVFEKLEGVQEVRACRTGPGIQVEA
ncbi:MAG: diphosphomevalonate decarboxylase [Myxococcota bacterium]